VLVCPPEPEPTAWVKCFACSKQQKPEHAFALLMSEAKKRLQGKTKDIFALGFHDWFRKCLVSNSFKKFQEVVVLYLDNSSTLPEYTDTAFIRPMELADIEQVAKVDASAFEPQWSLSSRELQAAYFQASHVTVAEYQGQIVGYELSTSNRSSAHLARVAVLPTLQRKRIGYQLVAQMLQHFQSKGIFEITVNTQNTNHASLQLYKELGFVLTGERFPIYRDSLTQITGQ